MGKIKPLKKSGENIVANLGPLLTIGVFLFLFVFFTAVSFHRLNAFQIFYYDFGIFARIIWDLSRLKAPIFDHHILGNIFFLADHFNPSLAILAPLFWITPNIKILLVEQAAVTTLSGVLIYLIAKSLKFAPLSSLLVALSYLFFAGVENPLVTDWHPEPTAGFLLLLFFYLFCFTKKKWLSYLVVFVFLGFKESNPITFLYMLSFLFFVKKEKRKEIAGFALLSLAWLFMAVRLVPLFFSNHPSIYTPQLPSSVLEFLRSFVSMPDKLHLVYLSLLSFGFLPLLFPIGLIAIAGELAIRLVPSVSLYQSYTLGMHYNVFLGIFLGLSSAYAIVSIKKLFRGSKKVEYFLVLYLFCAALLVARKVTFSPINLAINPFFWQNLRPQARLQQVIDKVPKKGSVASQNNLLSHFLARDEKIYLFTKNYKKYSPDIILLDISPDQNPNNYWESAVADEFPGIMYRLGKDEAYKRIPLNDKYIFLFIKK